MRTQVLAISFISTLLTLPNVLIASPPPNDLCRNALPITLGDTTGTTHRAHAEGTSTCDRETSPDVWYRYDGPLPDLPIAIDTVGSRFDTVVSIHTRCPEESVGRDRICFLGCTEIDSTITCNDNAIDEFSGVLVPPDTPPRFLIRVTGTTPAEGGDFTLRLAEARPAGGWILDARTREPIRRGTADLLHDRDGLQASAVAVPDEDGHFVFPPMPPGTYRFGVKDAPPYVSELYDGVPCPRDDAGDYLACAPFEATPLVARAGDAPRDVLFELEQGGRIRGRVRDRATGDGVAGALVQARLDGLVFAEDRTDTLGRYVLDGLIAGSFVVSTAPPSHRGQIYPFQTCLEEICRNTDFEAGTPVEIMPGRTVGSIDFSLDRFSGLRGKVTDATDGTAVTDAEVQVYRGRIFVRAAPVDAQGHYTLAGLEPDSYHVVVRSQTHRSELLGGFPCVYPENSTCNPTVGEDLELLADTVESDIHFALDRFPSIAGRVLDVLTGEPLAGVDVQVSRQNDRRTATTDAEGRYHIPGNVPGEYLVQTLNAAPYVDELLGGKPCNAFCTFDEDDTVTVDFGIGADNIDLALSRGGAITGRVRDAQTGLGIPMAEILIEDASGEFQIGTQTGPDGQYIAQPLPQGFLFARASARHHNLKIFDDSLCDPDAGPCLPRQSGLPIAVRHDATTADVDFALDRPSGISGTIRDLDGDPLMNVRVTVYDESGAEVGEATSDYQGLYTLTPLIPGTYYAVADSAFSAELPILLWPDILCPSERCDPENPVAGEGQGISVHTGLFTQDVDFTLPETAVIRGRVTDERTGQPLSGIRVDIWSDEEWHVTHAITGPTGRYRAKVAPGRYFVSTENGRAGGISEVHDDRPCAVGSVLRGTCDLSGAGRIEPDIHADAVVDFALDVQVTCIPDPVTLCLGERGRFRVGVEWAVGERADTAHAIGLTEDSGYFWFFNEDNVEMVVKVLNACPLESNHFWVFAGGLTDVATELTVTDTWTGSVQHYDTLAGQPFQPLLDTRAFATCDVFNETQGAATEPAWQPELALLPECEGELCLNEGRFAVDALWTTPDGSGGTAPGVFLTGDSGYFWFFNEDNIEVVVKVLDGCNEPQNTYWVFAAGLTDVEVTLRVTDRETGQIREYTNPLGTPFQPILDTQAFATCP